jgi:hypothetical protein
MSWCTGRMGSGGGRDEETERERVRRAKTSELLGLVALWLPFKVSRVDSLREQAAVVKDGLGWVIGAGHVELEHDRVEVCGITASGEVFEEVRISEDWNQAEAMREHLVLDDGRVVLDVNCFNCHRRNLSK